jgi:hypothetical protein
MKLIARAGRVQVLKNLYAQYQEFIVDQQRSVWRGMVEGGQIRVAKWLQSINRLPPIIWVPLAAPRLAEYLRSAGVGILQ